MAQPKVGVTVISGFLGSGKTTLLQRIVRDPVIGPKVAVIVNDLGELGLDHELIASQGTTPTLRVTSLVSGCVCCTLRSDLGQALLALGSGEGLGRRPEHILVEPSGAARASEVSFAINALGFEAPVQTDAVITLVDAHNAARSRREHPDLYEDQLRAADLVLINKSDLLPDPAARAALDAELAELAPRASRLWCERSAVDLQLLLGELSPATAPSSPGQGPGHGGGPAHDRGHGHGHEHGHDHAGPAAPSAHGLTAVSVEIPFAVDRTALEDFLAAQADRIFRIKGVVDTLEDGPLTVQAVGDRVELDALPPLSPLRRGPRRLVFIGDAALLRELPGPGPGPGPGPADVQGHIRLPAPGEPAAAALPPLLADLVGCARGGI